MLRCRGKVQEANSVIHLIVEQVADLMEELKHVSGLDVPFPLVSGRGDEAKGGGSGPDSREPKQPPVHKPRDMYEPDVDIDTLKGRSRNFR
jgi:error-prone DNA polymerase